MDSISREFIADPARWETSRGLKPKGKRKVARRGGVKKRRRRNFNMQNLKGARKPCVCSKKCICDAPIVLFDAQVQTDDQRTHKVMVNKSTEIAQYSRKLAKVSTVTSDDIRFAKCGVALARLKKTIPVGFHWSSAMIVVCLKLVFNVVYKFHWNWTKAVNLASQTLNLKRDTVFAYANDFLDNEDIVWPREIQMKMRGRGSITFIDNHGKDKYSVLKEVLVFACIQSLFFCLFTCCVYSLVVFTTLIPQ